MVTYKSFIGRTYPDNELEWQKIALEIFQFQAEACAVYRSFISQLGVDPKSVKSVGAIPFLPIAFFKNHQVKSGVWQEEVLFRSSGTTGAQTSSHVLPDKNVYVQHAAHLFENAYGAISGYHILALLPSYLERQGSSLIAMVDHLIARSGSPHSGFYLHNRDELIRQIQVLAQGNRKVLLLGVTFALMDLADQLDTPFHVPLMVMETGGMKGRRPEITRMELHEFLTRKIGVANIHSEYGMTELSSQAYSSGAGIFQTNPALRVLIRDITCPQDLVGFGVTGGVNVIDLANVHSCSFIETEDLGKLNENGTFEIVGRLDTSDTRGCNLLV